MSYCNYSCPKGVFPGLIFSGYAYLTIKSMVPQYISISQYKIHNTSLETNYSYRQEPILNLNKGVMFAQTGLWPFLLSEQDEQVKRKLSRGYMMVMEISLWTQSSAFQEIPAAFYCSHEVYHNELVSSQSSRSQYSDRKENGKKQISP